MKKQTAKYPAIKQFLLEDENGNINFAKIKTTKIKCRFNYLCITGQEYFQNTTQPHMFHPTICSTLPYVPPYHMFHPTICSTLPYVPPYHMFHPTICSTLPYVPPYHTFHPTICSTLPYVPPYRICFTDLHPEGCFSGYS